MKDKKIMTCILKFILVPFVVASHLLLPSSARAAGFGAVGSTCHMDTQELQSASHVLHMMWLADRPENRLNIREVVSKAYEWARLDPAIHVIVWHNDPIRSEISFPREPEIRKLVTIRHVSALCEEIPYMIRTLPCNMSRKEESLADDLLSVLPTLLGDGATGVNIYPQCDLAKILMMYYHAQKYSEKGFMCADSTIRPHKISELWSAYQHDLRRFGIVMANMAFPAGLEERQAMIAENPRIREEGGTILASTAPGFENSAFLSDCRHTIMLSVVAATILRPLASRVINVLALNNDHECLFRLMKGSFFYLNLLTRGDGRLSIINPQDLFSACGTDLVRLHTCWEQNGFFLQQRQVWVSDVRTDEAAPVRLQGSLLQKYLNRLLLNAANVETVLRGGFIQDITTGRIIMRPLNVRDELFGDWLKEQILDGKDALWYEVGDLAHLAVPIMERHTLLTKKSHFSKKPSVGQL